MRPRAAIWFYMGIGMLVIALVVALGTLAWAELSIEAQIAGLQKDLAEHVEDGWTVLADIQTKVDALESDIRGTPRLFPSWPSAPKDLAYPTAVADARRLLVVVSLTVLAGIGVGGCVAILILRSGVEAVSLGLGGPKEQGRFAP